MSPVQLRIGDLIMRTNSSLPQRVSLFLIIASTSDQFVFIVSIYHYNSGILELSYPSSRQNASTLFPDGSYFAANKYELISRI